MSLDLGKLLLIMSGTMLLGGVAFITARGISQRLMLLGLLGGMAFYSGIGASDTAVAPRFIGFYFALFTAIILGFYIGRVMFQPVSLAIGHRVPQAVESIMKGNAWCFVIILYVLLSSVPLIWPEFRLHFLLRPPSPDLRAVFYKRFTEGRDPILHVVSYAVILMTPFFYVALYRLRHRSCWIAFVFSLLMYVDYVATGYIGRSDVMMYFTVLVLGIWFAEPRARRRLFMMGIIFSPLVLYALYWYGRIRIGGVPGDISIFEGALSLLYSEIGFPRMVGMRILELGARVDLRQYFTWIVTLPFPKLLTGAIEGARINYEISELVLGLPRGAPGWYIVLPGLVAESIYIYGEWFFWLHGALIGAMAAFFARFAERVPQFLFLYLYLVIQFSYVLNRGGIAGVLPKVINEFLLFYVFVFALVLRPRSKQLSVECSNGVNGS